MAREVTPFPLCWPDSQARTPHHRRQWGSFGSWSVYQVFRDLHEEVRRLGGKECVISSGLRVRNDGFPYADQRQPDDPAAAVWFKRKGKDYVLACDRFNRATSNIRALVLSIDSLRRLERYGTDDMLEQAFYGFQVLALPTAVQETWWHVLECDPDATLGEAEAAYRSRAKESHPDAGGSDAAMARVNDAYERARREIEERQ